MGKKGSWFSAIKRVFTHNSKEKPTDVSDKKSSTKGKKKGKGILSNGENKSFIPLFREPSSIEKILGEADHLFIRPPTPSDAPKTPPVLPVRPISPTVASRRVSSPKAASPIVSPPRAISPPKAVSPKAAPRKSFTAGATSSKAPSVPKVTQSRKEIISYVRRAEPSLANQHLSATRIQAAYRGYLARRSFRALKGLVRLQGVVRGQNVKRQTMSAMKQMQLLVRVQTQIQSRRIQMLENQAYNNNNQVENTLSKWTLNQLSEAGENGDWDDSSLTKEEVEARMRKKVEAVIKRERAMAYAYSHQLWKSTPKSAQSPMDIRSNGFPWWWNWLERQLPQTSTSQTTQAPKTNISSTPTRPVSAHKRSPLSNNYNKPSNNFAPDNHDSLTPRSSTSAIPFRAKQFQTPTRTPPSSKYPKPRASAANSAYDAPLKDDDSLMSCPPFSVPNYMAPTVSAKAKTRANSNPKERFPGTPGNDSNRRFSFPLTPNIGSFKWNKGSNKDSASQLGLEKHESPRSVGGFSMGSAVSMPALVGRKPFNRFV